MQTRKPKSSGGKGPPADTPTAGGRAWSRAQQFAISRGLPTAIDPGEPEAVKAGKRAGTPRVRGAADKQGAGTTTIRRRKKN